MVQQRAGTGVDVWPRILRLAGFEQDLRYDVEDAIDRLEDRVVLEVLLAEFVESGEARIGDAQNGVAVARNNLAAVERFPRVFFKLLLDGRRRTSPWSRESSRGTPDSPDRAEGRPGRSDRPTRNRTDRTEPNRPCGRSWPKRCAFVVTVQREVEAHHFSGLALVRLQTSM